MTVISDKNVRNLQIESNLNPSNYAPTFYNRPEFNSCLFEGLTTVSFLNLFFLNMRYRSCKKQPLVTMTILMILPKNKCSLLKKIPVWKMNSLVG